MTTLRIERDTTLATADGEAGFGALETGQGRLPLTALNVCAEISGLVARITVEQTFRNALDVPLEATYIFPLPDRAAVTSFRMQVGQRVVEAELKERGQARSDYDAAIKQGFRAAIAEEERSGTFNLRVGNIPPHETVTLKLTLVGPLPVAGGEATFRFPLVVAPRYVPGIPLDGPPVGAGYGPDTDQVPDASRITPPVLLPGFPNPVHLGLQVEIDPAGILAPLQSLRSSLHTVIVSDSSPWTVRLEPGERLDRDFILRIPVCTAEVRSTLQCGAQPGDSAVFGLTLVPPAVDPNASRQARDVVILLDRSGSMGGWKMVAARRAVGRIVDTLLDQDQFTILAFDEATDFPPHAKSKLIAGTNQNRWKAVQWLGKVDARGGTELGPAMEAGAKLLKHSDADRAPVMIIVTDGEVAGEDVVLRSLQSAAGGRMPRIHTLGIDRAVNQGLLQRLADLGQGTCDVVESESRLDQAMDHIHSTIATPALTQLRLEPIGWQFEPESLSPERLPDLFVDRPVMIFGRSPASGATLCLRVHGIDAAGRTWQQQVTAQPAPVEILKSLWGRVKVRELEDRYAADGRGVEALQKQIVEISLFTGVLSRFTAFVAVDRSQIVNAGGQQHAIVQPVEMAEGWEMGRRLLAMTGAACYSINQVSFMRHKSKSRSMRAPRDQEVPKLRSISEIVAELRKKLHQLTQRKVLRAKSVTKQLDRIDELFGELESALRQENRGAEADQLRKQIREIVAKYGVNATTKPRTLDEATRKRFADDHTAILDSIEPVAAHPPAGRANFWT